MSYQEKLVGSSAYFIFALSILLVYFVLAGQYESWITPAAVILAVPMALLGTAAALLARRHRQQHLRPDRPRAPDRPLGQERHPHRRDGPGRARARAEHSRGDGRSLARAIPSDPDDVVHVHPRRAPARARERRRRRGAALARDRGRHRDAGLDVPRRPLRAGALRGAAAVHRAEEDRRSPCIRSPPARELPPTLSRRKGAARRPSTQSAGEVLHRAPGSRERHRVRDDPARGGGARRPAGLPVSADHAADGPGLGQLPGGEREDARRDGGAADRAAGQRRRGHALHAVDVARTTAATRSS